MNHLAPPDHQEAAVPDVGGVQLQVGVGEHHQARRARADHLGLALLHLTETLTRNKYQLHIITESLVGKNASAYYQFEGYVLQTLQLCFGGAVIWISYIWQSI